MLPYPKWKDELAKLVCGALIKQIIADLFEML